MAAYAVITDERGMLLAHWREHGASAWTLPGGGIDWGEDPADAVVREVREETGYEVVVEALLGIQSRVLTAAQRLLPGEPAQHQVRIVYRCRVVGGELRDEVGGSTDTAGWFALDAIEDLERVSQVDYARRVAGLL
ncbi:NUDIX domain-containing protein [Nocardioides mangrovicus]|uniref:NUDIX domain-containing protein n=1 Tax=Nocardioides mangrovicus TaxID=2478913 RepID=A0A3L8P898_9ACTN|nr:NUDIX domain-containing protein [Nocardioides mangrovicus]